MTFIDTIPVHHAVGEVRRMYEQSQARRGYVPNYAKLFSHRPHVMTAWENLIADISNNLDLRRYELITLAAARALRSSYCMLAHGKILRERFYAPDHLAAIAQDFTVEGLTPLDRAIMAFAEQIVRDATAITAADIQRLRDHGLTDAEIFDIAAATTARCFFSKLLDALGAEPDAAYLQLEEHLQRQLTVGRAISREAVEQLPEATEACRNTSESNPHVPPAAAVLELLATADTPGTICAVLTPAIKARLRELRGGQVLEVRVDDPSAREDIAAWCRLAGHEMVAVVDEMPKYTRYFLRKKHSARILTAHASKISTEGANS